MIVVSGINLGDMLCFFVQENGRNTVISCYNCNRH